MIVRPSSNKEIDDTISEVLTLTIREKNPPVVPFESGWSPYKASDFLIEEGLRPGDYHRATSEKDLWFATSQYLEIGGGALPNNVAFYIEGDEHAATLLKLVVNMNELEWENDTVDRFIAIARTLYEKALGEQMPSSIQDKIQFEAVVPLCSGRDVVIKREDWAGANECGYTVKFIVKIRGVLELGE